MDNDPGNLTEYAELIVILAGIAPVLLLVAVIAIFNLYSFHKILNQDMERIEKETLFGWDP